MGGKDSQDNAPSKIAEFNTTTNAWIDLNRELHSRDTSDLVVSPFPMSAIDCVPKCQCGIGNRKTRIFDGSKAEVRSFQILCLKQFLTRLMLTLGLLRFFERKTSYQNTSTASAVLCW